MKTSLSLAMVLCLCTPALFAQLKFNPKEVEKVKMVLTKEFKAPYKLDELNGNAFELEGSKAKKFINEFNSLTKTTPAEFNLCAVVVIYTKDGNKKMYYGNGKRFYDVTSGKIETEYYSQFAWNLVEKHFDLKKEVLCEN